MTESLLVTNPPQRGPSALSTSCSALELRQAARKGLFTGHTSGWAPGHVQGNLVILPKVVATDFLLYCKRNPKPCPVLAVTEPGHAQLPTLGVDLDIRYDLPRYRVWRHGELTAEPTEVGSLWQDDWVGVVLGCSFSFEQALMAQGIALRHVQQGRNVAMYRSSILTEAVGPFRGPMVVSMRPMKPEHALLAKEITARMPAAHGAPVHLGDPRQIGIEDLSRPDFGDAVELQDGEIPVFWACGVTPQAALAEARLPLCITHAPGCMLVTDLRNH